jgi:hypothetical protein
MYNDLPIKDRMAVVYYGIVGGVTWRNGVGRMVNIFGCAKTLRYNVTSKYPCDIFLHSWSQEYTKEILDAYRPMVVEIEPQEMFGYLGSQEELSNADGGKFRLLSRFTSFDKAMRLKRAYEEKNGFRYKWVLASRMDLIFYTPIRLDGLDSIKFYTVDEPGTRGSIPNTSRFWDPRVNKFDVADLLYLSNSDTMDKFSRIIDYVQSGEFDNVIWVPEVIVYHKLFDMFGGNMDMVQDFCTRHYDIEVYRTAMNNFSYGMESGFMAYCAEHGIDLKTKMEKLLLEIDDSL